MKNYNDLHGQRTGTSFKGYVLATYSDLIETFGEPTSNGDECKVDVEWILQTPHGTATIYNYKDGKAYLGENGLIVEQICEWHVGGKKNESYDWVKNRLQRHIVTGS